MNKDKFLVFLLLIIAICLVYVAFFKPQTQRYQIKEEIKREVTIKERLEGVTKTYKVFDTATGKQYVYEVYESTSFNPETMSRPETEIIPNNYVEDCINNLVIHRPVAKTITPDSSILGKRLKKLGITK